jgi:hypothetical protein
MGDFIGKYFDIYAPETFLSYQMAHKSRMLGVRFDKSFFGIEPV